MSFLARWLGFGKPAPRVGLRPHVDLDLPLSYDDAFARALNGVEQALGAYVSVQDPRGGLVEAAFGLVNNERIRCTLERGPDPSRTRIRVEAIFPAGAQVQENSRAVDALAAYLSAGLDL